MVDGGGVRQTTRVVRRAAQHARAIRRAIRAGDADALRQALAAIAELEFEEAEPEGAAAVIQAGAHVAIVEATREASRAGHSDALSEACRALQNLASGASGAAASTPLIQADAHVALVEAIRGAIRAGRPDVMLGACAAVVNLSCSAPEQAALTFQAGAPAALVEAIREAIRAGRVDVLQEVLEEACRALCNLAAGSREVTTAAALVQAGAHMTLVEAAREAIRAHLAATLELATLALRNLARGGDATKAALVRA
jgi:hypothetical protein